MTIGAKLVGLVLLSCLLTGGSVAAVALLTNRDGLSVQIEDRALEAVDFVGGFVASYAEDVQTAAHAMATHPDVIAAVAAGAPDRATAAITSGMKFEPRITEVTITDRGGTTLLMEGGNTRTERGAAPSAAELGSGDRVWGTADLSRIAGRPVMPYAVAVRDSSGAPAAILTAAFSLDSLTDALEDFNAVPAEAQLYDLRGTSILLSAADRSAIGMAANLEDEAIIQMLNGERSVVLGMGADGVPIMSAVGIVPGLPWGIRKVWRNGAEAASSPTGELAWQVAGAIGIATLLASLLAAWFTLSITGPLRRLHRAANALAAGDLDQRSNLTERDEIGEVGRAFDEMAASLQRQKSELEQSRQHIMTAEEQQRRDIAQP